MSTLLIVHKDIIKIFNKYEHMEFKYSHLVKLLKNVNFKFIGHMQQLLSHFLYKQYLNSIRILQMITREQRGKCYSGMPLPLY